MQDMGRLFPKWCGRLTLLSLQWKLEPLAALVVCSIIVCPLMCCRRRSIERAGASGKQHGASERAIGPWRGRGACWAGRDYAEGGVDVTDESRRSLC